MDWKFLYCDVRWLRRTAESIQSPSQARIICNLHVWNNSKDSFSLSNQPFFLPAMIIYHDFDQFPKFLLKWIFSPCWFENSSNWYQLDTERMHRNYVFCRIVLISRLESDLSFVYNNLVHFSWRNSEGLHDPRWESKELRDHRSQWFCMGAQAGQKF